MEEAVAEITAAVKNVPALRFPEFEGEWEKVPLSDKMDIFRGASPRPKGDPRYYGGNVPRLMIQDVTRDGKYAYPCIDYLTAEGAKLSRFLQAGSVVLSCSGTVVAIPGILGIDACIHDGFLGFRNFNGTFEEYLYYLFVKLHEKLQGEATTGGVFNNLTTDIARNLIMGFPSLAEQQKVVSFLTIVDDKIQQLSKKKALLEKYKKGVMMQIFSQKIRFNDDDGNNFPEWKEKKLSEILVEHKGRNSDLAIDEVLSVAKEKGVINQIEHLGRSYASDDISNYKVVYPNDVIYTKSPTSDFPYGIIKQNKLDRTGVVSVLYAVFKPINRNIGLLLDYYFSSWINTYNYLNPLVQKGAKNTMNINNSEFLNGRKISLPSSLEEQAKIASFLTSIDNKINYTSKQLKQAQQFKKGLLQQMFV